jgi:hypothetical protein
MGGLSSNMTIIDSYANGVSGSIAQIKSSSMATINASQISSNYYEATSTAVTSYLTNMPINLKLNTTVSGSTTLNINGYGVKGVKKIDTSGSIINVVSGDLIAGRYYLFIYDGTQFVLGGYDASTSGSLSYLYTGSGVITVTGSVVSHNTSGITTGSYNAVYVNQYGHVTAGSIVGTGTLTSPFVTTGSDSGLSNYRILSAGSYVTITSASTNGGSLIITGSRPGHIVSFSGGAQPQRSKINFTGTGVSGSDVILDDTTQVFIPRSERFITRNPDPYLWTTKNLGTADFDNSGGENNLYINKTTGSDVALALYSFSGSTYADAYGYFSLQTFDYQKSGFKFGFIETSSSKLGCVGVAADGTLTYENWNTPTSFSASAIQKINAIKDFSTIWFYIEYSPTFGNTRKYQFSIDGNFPLTTIYTTTANDFLTPDAFFFGVVKDVEDVVVKMYSFEPYSE